MQQSPKQLNAPLDKLALKDALDQLSDLDYVQQSLNQEALKPIIEIWNQMIDQKAFLKSQVQDLKFDVSVFQALLERRLKAISEPESGTDKLFDDLGWLTLIDEFNYVSECLKGRYSEKTVNLLIEHSAALMSPDDVQKYSEYNDEVAQFQYLTKLAKQRLELPWFYAVTISRLLQKAEYPLRVEDAYWLGLIDEIWGQRITCNLP